MDRRRIIRAIREVAKKLGRAPSRGEFAERTGISKYFVCKWFRGWTEAVQTAGLEPSALNAKIEDGALLEEWGRVVRESGGMLPRHEFRKRAKYNPLTLAKRFGGWTAVAQAFRKFARGKGEWADVVAMLPEYVRSVGRGACFVTSEEEDPEREKRKADSSASGCGRPQPEGRNDNPGQRAGVKPARHAHTGSRQDAGGTKKSWAGVGRRRKWYAARGDRATYGNPTPCRWLRHEPVNEQGVVLLFGMLAKELGYVIETVGTGFPDCEAKRQVGPGRWQQVRIEFEYESKNFREHGHRADGCDVIVCWRHNWKECPKEMEVVELAAEKLEMGG